MAGNKDKLTAAIPRHRILREIIRHFLEFEEYVSKTGNSVIEHGYWIYDDDGERKGKVAVTISFWDLHRALETLSERKRQAIYYNVIRDLKQKDVAKIMGITTVSVGQYVEQGVLQLEEHYFAGDTNETQAGTSTNGDRAGETVHTG